MLVESRYYILFMKTGMSSLMVAAKKGDSVIVQILIAGGAILDLKEKEVNFIITMTFDRVVC